MARKEKKYHFIYKTTNVLNGKYYIGMHSTNDLEDGYLGSGRRLRYSINKYGKENHIREIIEHCSSREELKKREEEVVNLNEIAKVECMNLKVGGEGGLVNDEHKKAFVKAGKINLINSKEKREKSLLITRSTDRYKENMSKSLKNYYKNNFSSFKGKKHSDETKQKISESSKGKGCGSSNSQYGSCWITNEIENKKIKRGDLIPEGWRLGRKMKN